MKILWGMTGSVACIKAKVIYDELCKVGDVRVVITESAQHFLRFCVKGKAPDFQPYTDKDEWNWLDVGDPVLHIDLKDWADVFVIAPLTANTMAKMVCGMCDNLLTSIYRAWPHQTSTTPGTDWNPSVTLIAKPVVVAPAMNTDMWENPITQSHLNSLSELGVTVVHPIEKKLACGATGMGAMNYADVIANVVKHRGMK
jgi:phosphopantothenoylcysteine decarboxylase